MIFYVMQNLLAMNARMSIHRRLGIVGLVLAIAVVCFGIAVTVRQVREGRFFPFPDPYSDLAVSTAQMTLFAGFIGIGLWLRRDGDAQAADPDGDASLLPGVWKGTAWH